MDRGGDRRSYTLNTGARQYDGNGVNQGLLR